jgi:hypothetical protein
LTSNANNASPCQRTLSLLEMYLEVLGEMASVEPQRYKLSSEIDRGSRTARLQHNVLSFLLAQRTIHKIIDIEGHASFCITPRGKRVLCFFRLASSQTWLEELTGKGEFKSDLDLRRYR